MIAGLEDINSGTISIDGQVVNDLPPKQRNIAMVFQSYALYPHMTVFDNMAFGLKLEKRSKDEINERVNEAARILQIEDYLQRKPKQLSGGQRQRVCIARALVMNPKLIIFDEPVSALDVSVKADILNLLNELKTKFNLTYVFISHDLAIIRFISDRVLVMKESQKVEIGFTERIYSNPKEQYTQKLLGSIP